MNDTRNDAETLINPMPHLTSQI